jgi:hypothetical protein
MICNIAAMEQRCVATLDVVGAYLNAVLKNPNLLMRLSAPLVKIIMERFPDYANYRDVDGSVIVRLKKALYGCVESANLWNELLTDVLTEIGFRPNRKDPCVFNKGFGANQVTVCFHVDDLLITSQSEENMEKVIDDILKKFKSCNVNRSLKQSYLGMTLDFSSVGKCKVTMEGYVNNVLSKYNVGTSTAATPATEKLFHVDLKSPTLTPSDAKEFHSRVATLLYLSRRVRPDLQVAVNFLTTRVQCSTDQDWDKLERVLRYLNATRDLGIVMEGGTILCVSIWIDASYGVHPNGKSHSGVVVTVGRGPIVAKSGKQKIVAKSSSEAELIAASDEVGEGIHIRDFLIEQGYTVGPATLHQDNMSTMKLIEKGRSTSDRTKHVNVRYFFVKDRVNRGEIEVRHSPTSTMMADILTKPLQGELFRKMRDALLNWK